MYACTSEFHQSKSENLVTKDIEGPDPSEVAVASAIVIIGQLQIYYTHSPRNSRVHVVYPGLLTPAFVTYSTNAGEGLTKLVTCSDVLGCWVDISGVQLVTQSYIQKEWAT